MKRALSLLETVVALSLALVLISALLAPRRAELDEVRARLEEETARLILEGELARARLQALEGRLAPGREPLRVQAWPSAARLRGLSLWRETGAPDPARGALRTVALHAEWRGGDGGGPRARSLTLGGLVPAAREEAR